MILPCHEDADLSEARPLLGSTAQFDIEDGLDRYIEWVQAHEPDLESGWEQETVENWH
jgi:nucleoside-diphosphate-sugar epimerase